MTTKFELDENQQVVYNVPDGLETDPEVIRAELLFYNSPLMESLSENVYGVLTNIQEQCEWDYQKFCSTSKTEYVEINDLLLPTLTMFLFRDLSTSRKLIATSEGKGFVNNLRAMYMPRSLLGISNGDELRRESVNSPTSAASPLIAQQLDNRNMIESSKPSVKSNVIVNGRLSKESKRFADGHLMPKRKLFSLGSKSERPAIDPPAPFPPGAIPLESDHGKRDRKHKPNHDDSDSESDNDSDEEDEMDSPWHHNKGDRNRPDPDHDRLSNPWEDHSFPGALGFGAKGDLCLYENSESLSAPCLNSIGQLHQLREQYWTQYSTNGPYGHHHGNPFFHFLFAFFAIFGFVVFVKRLVHRKKFRAVHDLLVGLNNDAELKNVVENRLNVVVPEVAECAWKGHSLCARLFYFLGFTLVALVLSVLITISSLELTAVIVNKLDEGNGSTTTPGTAMLILFVLCSVQVAAVAWLARSLKKCCALSRAPATNSNLPDSTTISGPRSGFSQLRTWVVPRVSAVSSAWQRISRRAADSFGTPQNGYVPLNGDETEMISVGSLHGQPLNSTGSLPPRIAIYTGVPLRNSHIESAMVPSMPIQATPVTAVHFV